MFTPNQFPLGPQPLLVIGIEASILIAVELLKKALSLALLLGIDVPPPIATLGMGLGCGVITFPLFFPACILLMQKKANSAVMIIRFILQIFIGLF